MLSLTGLNLALSKCKNSGGGDAVLGQVDGKNLGSLWTRRGVTLSSSIGRRRGVWKAAGLTFDLRLPLCPRNVLELKLPADRVLSVAAPTVLVTGPHDAESSAKRIWRNSGCRCCRTGDRRPQGAARGRCRGDAHRAAAEYVQASAEQRDGRF